MQSMRIRVDRDETEGHCVAVNRLGGGKDATPSHSLRNGNTDKGAGLLIGCSTLHATIAKHRLPDYLHYFCIQWLGGTAAFK